MKRSGTIGLRGDRLFRAVTLETQMTVGQDKPRGLLASALMTLKTGGSAGVARKLQKPQAFGAGVWF